MIAGVRVLLDPRIPAHVVRRVDAGVRMASAGGIRYDLFPALEGADLRMQGLRHWPAIVLSQLTPDHAPSPPHPKRVEPDALLVPVVGYVREADMALVGKALNRGLPLHGLLIEGVSDQPRDVVEALCCAQRHVLPPYVEGELKEIAGGVIGTMSMRALLDGRRITVPLLARYYCASPRTLRRHFASRGLPTPERWVAWLSTIAASAYLSTHRTTVERASFNLGYGSGAALSQVCRRLTGMGLSSFSGPGGCRSVLVQLRNVCAADCLAALDDEAASTRTPR